MELRAPFLKPGRKAGDLLPSRPQFLQCLTNLPQLAVKVLRQAWDATIKRSLNLGVPFEKSRLQFFFAKIESTVGPGRVFSPFRVTARAFVT